MILTLVIALVILSLISPFLIVLFYRVGYNDGLYISNGIKLPLKPILPNIMPKISSKKDKLSEYRETMDLINSYKGVPIDE